MTDTRNEFLADWFVNAKLSPIRRQPSLTYFGIDTSQPLGAQRTRGCTRTG
jgi:hypothetical protein